jgi:hypothetical protein
VSSLNPSRSADAVSDWQNNFDPALNTLVDVVSKKFSAAFEREFESKTFLVYLPCGWGMADGGAHASAYRSRMRR